jgi:hypothetical protein
MKQMLRIIVTDATKYTLCLEGSEDKYLYFHVSAVYSDGTAHCNATLLTLAQFKQWSSTTLPVYLSYYHL